MAIRGFALIVRLASVRSSKARAWLDGRRDWKQAMASVELEGCVWFHCASVGEFEQARPVIESLRQEQPERKILLTFYSPSGFELRKNYDRVDHVAYLPVDTPANMRDWLDLVRPAILILTKYDFWFNLMAEAHARQIPMRVVSVHLPEGHWLFRWPGSLLLPRLRQFEMIYVQEKGTQQRLAERNVTAVKVVGDTRTDRVMMNVSEPIVMEGLEKFAEGQRVIVAGSIWPKDSELLLNAQPELKKWKWIVASHEPDDAMLQAWKERFGSQLFHWSDREQDLSPAPNASVIYINFVGLLSKLYGYGEVAYVGGGFGSGIHNILEPAAYGIPVVFGPKHQRFAEAEQLLASELAATVTSSDEMVNALNRLTEQRQQHIQEGLANYFEHSKGASTIIVNDLLNQA